VAGYYLPMRGWVLLAHGWLGMPGSKKAGPWVFDRRLRCNTRAGREGLAVTVVANAPATYPTTAQLFFRRPALVRAAQEKQEDKFKYIGRLPRYPTSVQTN
jgi:hypothetical protein